MRSLPRLWGTRDHLELRHVWRAYLKIRDYDAFDLAYGLRPKHPRARHCQLHVHPATGWGRVDRRTGSRPTKQATQSILPPLKQRFHYQSFGRLIPRTGKQELDQTLDNKHIQAEEQPAEPLHGSGDGGTPDIRDDVINFGSFDEVPDTPNADEPASVSQRDASTVSSEREKPPRQEKRPLITIDNDHLIAMLRTIRTARRLGLPDSFKSYQAEPAWLTTSKADMPPDRALTAQSRQLRNMLNRKRRQPLFRARMKERVRLPMMAKHVYERVVELIDEAEVLVIAGSTACGKTTQVPQIILDYAIHRGTGAFCSIACTQPRRISATSIARRVAYERCEPLGESVGYQIRFDSRLPGNEGSIVYCTSGILLKRLQEDPDFIMAKMTHLIIDEVHERSIATDHLLTLIRDLIYHCKGKGLSYPKLILMSATIDSKEFLDYFGQPLHPENPTGLETRFLEVTGRSFPVESHYLDEILPKLQAKAEKDRSIENLLNGKGANPDSQTPLYIRKELDFATKSSCPSIVHEDDMDDDTASETEDDAHSLAPTGLTAAAIAQVATDSASGDILAFLPGIGEIDKTAELLISRKPLGLTFNDDKFKLFKLHSSLGESNDDVFKPVPEGCRRIVIATNIAESSITLPGVEHVIDMGKVRHYKHDQLSGNREYAAKWISKASSKQRFGRAGRVRPGHYYALFTEERYNSFEDHPSPEMLRHDLLDTCLEVRAQRMFSSVSEFLGRCPAPPDPRRVIAALQTLKRMGALTEDEELTALGRVLSLVPLPPASAKTVLLGILFRCLEPMLIIGCYDEDTPFIHDPVDRRGAADSKRTFAERSESDMIAITNAFRAYDSAAVHERKDDLQSLRLDRYIRPSVYQEISLLARQIYQHLADAKLVPQPGQNESIFTQIPPELNVNATNIALIKALLMTTLTPNVANARSASGRDWMTADGERAYLTPRLVNTVSKNSALKRWGRKRGVGDLMAYSSRRDVQEDKYPWIQAGGMITPLMGILFADIAETGEKRGMIRLNGLINLHLQVENNSLALGDDAAATLLLEFRKAIERFLMMAFEDLRYAKFSRRSATTDGNGEDEEVLKSSIMRNYELRDAFVSGLAGILQKEDDALMEKFRIQREVALKEEKEEKERIQAEMAQSTRLVSGAPDEPSQQQPLTVAGSG